MPTTRAPGSPMRSMKYVVPALSAMIPRIRRNGDFCGKARIQMVTATANVTKPARNQTMCDKSVLGLGRLRSRHIRATRTTVPIAKRRPACSSSRRGASAIVSAHPARVVQRLISDRNESFKYLIRLRSLLPSAEGEFYAVLSPTDKRTITSNFRAVGYSDFVPLRVAMPAIRHVEIRRLSD